MNCWTTVVPNRRYSDGSNGSCSCFRSSGNAGPRPKRGARPAGPARAADGGGRARGQGPGLKGCQESVVGRPSSRPSALATDQEFSRGPWLSGAVASGYGLLVHAFVI